VKTTIVMDQQDIALACKEKLERSGYPIDSIVVDIEFNGPAPIPVVKAIVKAGWAPMLQGAEDSQ
jgi:hypothetical protein